MRTITVNTHADLLALSGVQDARVVFGRGVIEIPSITVIRNLTGVVFDGPSAPKGRACFYGAPLQFIDCRGQTLVKCALHCAKPPTMKIEKSWGYRWLSTKPDATWDISLIGCSIRGNTDETAFRRDDFMSPMALAGSGFRIESCMIGPSATSTDPARGNHNFGLAFTRCDYVTVVNSAFGGHNRRLVQLQGASGLIAGNVFADWGTMCIGLHAGTSVDIRHNLYLMGPHSPNRIAPVMPVVGTSASAFGALGGINLRLSDQRYWGAGVEPVTCDLKWRGEPGITYPVEVERVLPNAGVQDSVDRALALAVKARQGVEWVAEVPLVRSDYE